MSEAIRIMLGTKEVLGACALEMVLLVLFPKGRQKRNQGGQK